MLERILVQIERLATHPHLPWEEIYYKTVAMSQQELLQHLHDLYNSGGFAATAAFAADLDRAGTYLYLRDRIVGMMEIFVIGLYVLLFIGTWLWALRALGRIEREKQVLKLQEKDLVLGKIAAEEV